MNLRILNQQAGVNAFHQRLEDILNSVSNRSSFRVLTAFVKMSGLNLISEVLENYLRHGGRTHWIIGLDLGITSPDALRYLSGLDTRFRSQVNVQVFSSGSHFNVFHPKLYMIQTTRKLLTWIGSANVTGGGLLSNFECLVELDIDRRTDREAATLLEDVWASYASPSSTNVHLESLTPELISRVEKEYGPEQPTESITPSHPLSDIDRGTLPKAPVPPRLKMDGSPSALPQLQAVGNELIMEILTETRETQVQIPVNVLNQYFGLRNDERAVITLYNKKTGQIKNRPLVHHRGMHRVEMEFIKGLSRPLIVKIVRDPFRRDTYNYEFFKRGSKEFNRMKQLLQTQGQRTNTRARRWLIR